MILTKDAILNRIKSGDIKIEPFNLDNLGDGSMDLTLSNEFRIFKKGIKNISITETTDYKEYTQLIKTKMIKLKPGELILGITQEKLKLPPNLCGWLQGRSRFARLGLTVHVTASFVQPGSENRQVMEIINLNKIPLTVHEGDKIMQIVFENTEGKSTFQGKFRNQEL